MTVDANTLVAIISALVSIPTTVIVFFLSQNYILAKNRNRLIRYISGRIMIFSTEEDMKKYIENGKGTANDSHSSLKFKTFREYLLELYICKGGIFALAFFLLIGTAWLVANSSLHVFLYWALVPLLFMLCSFFGFPYLFEILGKSSRLMPYRFVFKLYHRDYFWFTVIFYMAYFGASVEPNLYNQSFLLSYGETIVIPISFIFLLVYILPVIPMLLDRSYEMETTEDLVSDLYILFFRKYLNRMIIPMITVDVGGAVPIKGTIKRIGKDVLTVEDTYINWESILYFRIEGIRTH